MERPHLARSLHQPTPRWQHAAYDENRAGDRNLLELVRLMGCRDEQLPRTDLPPVAQRYLNAGEVLFDEGARASAIHFVRTGTFKIYSTQRDGYEQVLAFAGCTDVLGFDAINPGRYPNSAMALEGSTVFILRLEDYLALGKPIRVIDRMVLRAVSSALARRSELADVMAAVSAEVRLARFLLHLSRRMEHSSQSTRCLQLRMGRRDIASYIGVAHETVSRSFTALANWGLIQVDNRSLEILDRKELEAFCCGTRRPNAERMRDLTDHSPVQRAAPDIASEGCQA